MAKPPQTVAEFLQAGGTITKCPSSMKQAPSLARMRKDEAARMEEEEQQAQEDREVRERELFGEAKAAGFSTSEALEYSQSRMQFED